MAGGYREENSQPVIIGFRSPPPESEKQKNKKMKTIAVASVIFQICAAIGILILFLSYTLNSTLILFLVNRFLREYPCFPLIHWQRFNIV